MNQVHILVQGYAKPGRSGEYLASPTSSLIVSKGKKLLVDPGTNQELLLAGLSKHGLTPHEIDGVFLSHYHPDHFLNLTLFSRVDLYDGTTLWRGEKEIEHNGNIMDMDVELLPTPGHAPEHTSILVKSENDLICVAQDVFWWEDGKQDTTTVEQLLGFEDPFASDPALLQASRKLVLQKANVIIPGHGKKFTNPIESGKS